MVLMIIGSNDEKLTQTGRIEATNVLGLIAAIHAVFNPMGTNYREIAKGNVNLDRNFSSTILNAYKFESVGEGSL